jgi:hypothetical protein
MLRRLTLGFAIALVTAPTMFAAELPWQATSRLPWDKLPSWALDALCTYLNVGCN